MPGLDYTGKVVNTDLYVRGRQDKGGLVSVLSFISSKDLTAIPQLRAVLKCCIKLNHKYEVTMRNEKEFSLSEERTEPCYP